MRRGRKPKPTQIKRAAGNPGRRPLNPAEPAAKQGRPKCPRDISPEAAAEWERICELLAGMKLLTVQDGPAIRVYCEAHARYVEATRALAKYGLVFVAGKTKYPAQSPYLAIANSALKQMNLFFSEFGLTPSSRSRVKQA